MMKKNRFNFLPRLGFPLAFSPIVLLLAGVGCVQNRPIVINSHEFIIHDLRRSIVEEVFNEIGSPDNKYSVTVLKMEEKPSIMGEQVFDYTFLIVNPKPNPEFPSQSGTFTIDQFISIVNHIKNPDRRDPIELIDTKITQVYASHSGAGTAEVRLRIELTENARAFYVANDQPVRIIRDASGSTAWFNYERKKFEEYVDIYVVPFEGSPDRRDLRISLSAPYETRVLEWMPGWKRALRSIWPFG